MKKKIVFFYIVSSLLLFLLPFKIYGDELVAFGQELRASTRAIYSLQSSDLYKPIYTGVNTPIASKFGFQPRATAQTKVSVYHNGKEIPNDGKRATINKEIIAANKPYIIATNMGIMNGRSIDVRFTPVSIHPQVNFLDTFFVGLDKNDTTTKYALLTVSDTGSSDPLFKLEFLDSQTKQPVMMSGNLTIGDVDNSEMIVIEPVGSRVDSIYALSDTILNTDSSSTPEKTIIRAQNSKDVSETDRRAWVSVAYENASHLLITYSCFRTGLFFGYQEFEEFDYVEEVEPPNNLATVDVFHKNESGIEIAEKVQLHGLIGTIYQSQPKTIPGYKLLKAPSNAIGLFAIQTPSVTYLYEQMDKPLENQGSVRVFHKNGNGVELAPMEILTGDIGTIYQAQPKTITGYKLTKEPTNRIGMIDRVNSDVIFVYEAERETEYTNPLKQADADGILDDTRILYSISQQVPAFSTETALTNFAIKDALPSVLTIDSVHMYNQSGTLVDYMFNITQSGQNVFVLANPTYLANSLFYNTTYRMDIQTHLSGKEIQPFMDQTGRELWFPNKATVFIGIKKTGETLELLSNETVGRIQLQTVTVKHVGGNGEVLAPEETLSGVLGASYQSSEAVIDSYQLTEQPLNGKGTYGKLNQDVIYVYQKVEAEGGNLAPNLKLAVKEGVSDGKDYSVVGIWKDDSSSVLILYKVDDQGLKLAKVFPNLQPGTWQPFSYQIPSSEIPIGNHKITFYAHDNEGLSSLGETIVLKPKAGASLTISFRDEDGEDLAAPLSIPVVINDKVELSNMADLQLRLAALKNQGYELTHSPANEQLIEVNETTIVFTFKGLISLVDVTKEMLFKPGLIGPLDQSLPYEGNVPFKLTVQDFRAQNTPAEGFKRGQFQIVGVLSVPFKQADGRTLNRAKLIYNDGTMEREISTTGNEIYRSNTANPAKTYEIKLSDESNNELRLEVPKGSGVSKGTYQAEITWELIQGP
ncbi:MucBP domain-containing protein [uncultured Vagococcus sp.]|uniref:MucBP domain-containing protein n=1 Tax=uncultured Vagococcus sp. TaxID=189676 RepID=UPI0028D55C9E|nr:MucBP domain-containing protein [uncultured Vagococcus sp.]